MSEVIKMSEPVHGYKVFDPDWTCEPNGGPKKQYSCPGKFEEDVELKLCKRGMHFCQNVADCFNYYNFNSRNKVAEVIAYGEIVTDGVKLCTDKIEIVRELSWHEVLDLINTGSECPGFGNTGDHNTGYRNTGNKNTGDKNTGDKNTGDRNRGSDNSGDFNIGDRNTGKRNKGSWNSGDENSGVCNTGDHNIGNGNSGDWNKSSYNSGCFNVKEHKIMMFDKPSDITYEDWLYSKPRALLAQIPQNNINWRFEENMTDQEKKDNPSYKTTGGYLKTFEAVESRQQWWDNHLTDSERDIIKAIPNFDPDIFYECTGIRVY